MRDNVFEKVADILRDVLDAPELLVTEDMTMEDVCLLYTSPSPRDCS